MEFMTVYDEIDALWLSHHKDVGREASSRADFRALRENIEKNSAELVGERFETWLSVLDLGIEWLSYVHLALSNDDEIGPREPRYRAPWALVGAATAFACGIRKNCLLGLDTPAKALLRSYTETLFLCLATLHDEDLAREYVAADTDSKVVEFWHKKASPKKLHERIMAIERKFGIDEEGDSEMTQWRRQEYEIMSQSSHLSYLAAAMTCLPASLEKPGMHGVGIWGRASESLYRTLSYAARTAWYFSRFSFEKIIGRQSSDHALLVLDRENENHISVIIGRDVLSEVTLKYWEE